MYRVIEVADILGVSKVTVYKKIELLKPEIMGHIKNEDGVIYINDNGVQLIKKSLKRRVTSKPKDKAQLKVIELNCEMQDLRDKIDKLLEEDRKKQKQIEDDILLNLKYISTMANGKREELKRLQVLCDSLRKQLDEANVLVSRLKAIDDREVKRG